ncbi:MAG: hypothetical protein RMK89_11740 [Armatimonadota bacterium]|nr:hypothetical protein [Armatimonadota bacterium]MDW8144120.1 hypothetical protein [Armatimonadota bacterium]
MAVTVQDKTKEATKLLRKALQLKSQIERLEEQLKEIRVWFADNFPSGYEAKGIGKVIVRWQPKLVLDLDGLIRHIRNDPKALEAAVRLANPNHTLPFRLRDAGYLDSSMVERLVTKVGEEARVEFRRD